MNVAVYPKYQEFQDTELEISEKIPVHWQVWKVAHAFRRIGSGTTPDTGRRAFYDGEIAWLQTGDLTDGVVTYTSKTISSLALREYSTLKVYPSGSLVMAMYGATIGKLGKLQISSATNQACCVFSESSVVTTNFAFYSLLAMRPYILADAYGGGQPNISQQTIKTFRLTLPPLPEQRAIAAFLDGKCAAIDEAVRIKEAQIKLLRERRQILIQQAVTRGLNPDTPMKDSGIDWIGQIPAHWEQRHNKFIFTLKKKLVGKRAPDYDLLSLTLQGIIKRDMENLEGKFPAEFGTYQEVKSGDFVFCHFDVQETPRTVGLSSYSGMITGAYTVYETSVDINPRFLLHFYIFADTGKKMRGLYKGLRNTIPKDSFAAFKTPLPPREEQNAIVEYIDDQGFRIDDAISIKQDQIAALKEYKTVLINAAVTGKIKVTQGNS